MPGLMVRRYFTRVGVDASGDFIRGRRPCAFGRLPFNARKISVDRVSAVGCGSE